MYEQCDALVFPSRYEGFGAPVAEAMVRGVPVISSNTTSLPEVVADGGVLLDPDDPVACATAIESVAADRAELSRRARERSTAFAPGPIVDELVALWRRSAA